jgi:hypothetical protein
MGIIRASCLSVRNPERVEWAARRLVIVDCHCAACNMSGGRIGLVFSRLYGGKIKLRTLFDTSTDLWQEVQSPVKIPSELDNLKRQTFPLRDDNGDVIFAPMAKAPRKTGWLPDTNVR